MRERKERGTLEKKSKERGNQDRLEKIRKEELGRKKEEVESTFVSFNVHHKDYPFIKTKTTFKFDYIPVFERT